MQIKEKDKKCNDIKKKGVSLKMILNEIFFNLVSIVGGLNPPSTRGKDDLHNLINNRMMKALGYKNGVEKTIILLTFYKSQKVIMCFKNFNFHYY